MSTQDNDLVKCVDNAFWQFSLHVYQNPDVKECCLNLQNSTGVNVNLLLLCCWLSSYTEAIEQAEFIAACRLVEDWHKQVTESLRQVRRFLKNKQSESWVNLFYHTILNAEITSEAYQQQLLFSYFKHRTAVDMSVNKNSSIISQTQSSAAIELRKKSNEEIALGYLHWLLNDMDIEINSQLNRQLVDFVKNTLRSCHCTSSFIK
ncbi:Uncharacterized conserved protein [Legionella lansingensis]|uniref:TIGR02444 family protein n=1 Tax=Legionella lansingensis TaxID=45067 RepID=A0A0W0VQ23_9GAMM|nr:TIGR02444 family protein [Legionella lansingensis]KTD22106.1 hypothetical protein Llan_1369 [Legionella lansingensis]SNV45754.1 Uncharacterized conserved protein [Legionella lansingensis]